MLPHNESARNMPMVSICHWLLKQYPEALDALLMDPPERSTLVPDAHADYHEVLLNYFSKRAVWVSIPRADFPILHMCLATQLQ